MPFWNIIVQILTKMGFVANQIDKITKTLKEAASNYAEGRINKLKKQFIVFVILALLIQTGLIIAILFLFFK